MIQPYKNNGGLGSPTGLKDGGLDFQVNIPSVLMVKNKFGEVVDLGIPKITYRIYGMIDDCIFAHIYHKNQPFM